MRRLLLALTFCTCSILLTVQTAVGFFAEVLALREELKLYETTHAADFTEIVAQLDEMTGTIFTDVHDGDWFHPYVTSLADWGIVSGYKDAQGRHTGEYRPGNSVTVAEVLKMALESAEVREQDCIGTPTLLIARQHWARSYVVCAEKRGIRLLAPSLRLDRPATRAEVLAVVHDAFGDAVPPIYSQFKDTAGHRFEADIALSATVGIVSGDTDAQGNPTGIFRPDDSINRAEAAKILYERLKLVAQADLSKVR